MKTIIFKILLLCLYLMSYSSYASCGNLTLNSQEQVNNFPNNFLSCQSFDDLIISGSDIVDLTPLLQITTIYGDLRISGNSSLNNIDGLNNITYVGGDVYIHGYNSPLTNLDGLIGLQNIQGYFQISNCLYLTSIQGLYNLETVGGIFYIAYNNNAQFTDITLPNLSAVGLFGIENNDNLVGLHFTGLETVRERFVIRSNENIVSADFSALEIVGWGNNNDYQIDQGLFEVFQEHSLITPDFSSLHTIKGFVEFVQNNNLQELGFDNLQTVSRGINISSNPQLQSIDGLSNLSGQLRYLRINNSSITNLDALSNITSFGLSTGSVTGIGLEITNNPLLSDITGLSNVTQVNNLDIIGNDSLESLTGLENLTYISRGHLNIRDNESLEDIDALSNLESIGESGNDIGLHITSNPSLQNLNGLANLATLRGGIKIDFNEALSDVSALKITLLDGAHNSVWITDNNSLQTLSGLEVYELKGNFYISNNPLLEDIDITVTNESVVGSIQIFNNPLLTDLSGISKVKEATSYFIIKNNPSLTSLEGFNIEKISGAITIDNNALLQNIDDMSSLTTTWSSTSLDITNNPALTQIDGLINIDKIGKININNNASLKNIDGLSNVTMLTFTANTKELRITNNPVLESIQGIRNINQLYIGSLIISTNPMLAVCDLKNICEYLNTAKPKNIFNNAEGCTSISITQASCPTIWNGTSWSNGLPTPSRSAIIEGELHIDTVLEAKNFTVNRGNFKLLENGSLYVSGSVVNNLSEDSLVVHHNANLIQTSDAATRKNIGKIKVFKQSNPIKRLDYTMWSSPVDAQNLFAFSPHTINGVTNYPNSTGRIYVYEGESEYIHPAPYNENTIFTPGKGYLFRAPNNWNSNTVTPYEGIFMGVPNNGNYTVNTHANEYTSVGNPYPSNISADLLFAENPDVDVLYFWTNTYAPVDGTYTQNNYATYTLAGGTAVNENEVEPNGIISTGQGFIVSSSGSSINFNNDMRVDAPSSFFRTNSTTSHKFWINLTGVDEIAYNQILIAYMDNATSGIDSQIDGRMFGNSGSALYSIIENEKFVIQGKGLPFDVSDVVPLGFRAVNSGEYVISVTQTTGLFSDESATIYLKDNYLNIIHNLSESDYRFSTNQGEFEQRFEVIYKSSMSNDLVADSSTLQIYNVNDNIFLNSNQNIDVITIYDLQGRLLYQNQNINSNNHVIYSKQFGNQVLIINTLIQDKSYTNKILN